MRMPDAEKASLPSVPLATNPVDLRPNETAAWRAARKIYKYRPTEAAKVEAKRSERTDKFANFVLDIADLVGPKVPYAFKLNSGEETSLDWGCVGFLLNRKPPEIRLVEERGFVVAVEPTEALYHRYNRTPPPDQPDQGLSDDLEELERRALPETTRKTLIDARVGQGWFRQQLLDVWNNSCAVLSCDVPSLLRASHVKPWRSASDAERLDPQNGILLCAHLDAAFDAGLISFQDSGRMIVSPVLTPHSGSLTGLGMPLRIKPSSKLRRYLKVHRDLHTKRLRDA